jgi:hypothetical protein
LALFGNLFAIEVCVVASEESIVSVQVFVGAIIGPAIGALSACIAQRHATVAAFPQCVLANCHAILVLVFLTNETVPDDTIAGPSTLQFLLGRWLKGDGTILLCNANQNRTSCMVILDRSPLPSSS